MFNFPVMQNQVYCMKYSLKIRSKNKIEFDNLPYGNLKISLHNLKKKFTGEDLSILCLYEESDNITVFLVYVETCLGILIFK